MADFQGCFPYILGGFDIVSFKDVFGLVSRDLHGGTAVDACLRQITAGASSKVVKHQAGVGASLFVVDTEPPIVTRLVSFLPEISKRKHFVVWFWEGLTHLP